MCKHSGAITDKANKFETPLKISKILSLSLLIVSAKIVSEMKELVLVRKITCWHIWLKFVDFFLSSKEEHFWALEISVLGLIPNLFILVEFVWDGHGEGKVILVEELKDSEKTKSYSLLNMLIFSSIDTESLPNSILFWKYFRREL